MNNFPAKDIPNIKDLLLLDAEFWNDSLETEELCSILAPYVEELMLIYIWWTDDYLKLTDEELSWFSLLVREAL